MSPGRHAVAFFPVRQSHRSENLAHEREMLGDPGFLAVTAELCGQARRTWHGVEVGGMCPRASGILLSYS